MSLLTIVSGSLTAVRSSMLESWRHNAFRAVYLLVLVIRDDTVECAGLTAMLVQCIHYGCVII